MRPVLVISLILAAVTPASASHDAACGTAPETPGTPIGVVACDRVRPGGRILNGCTLNFVFRGSDGRGYIGAAGHCCDPEQTFESAWPEGTGRAVFDVHGRRFGTYAYAIDETPSDFALIRIDVGIDVGIPVDPRIPHLGGPTGINSAISGTPVLAHHVGWGKPSDPWPVATARPIVLRLCDPNEATGAGTAMGGDSGSPVVDDQRRAIGVLVGHIADTTTDPACAREGTRVTRLAPQLARAQQMLGISFSLETAPA